MVASNVPVIGARCKMHWYATVAAIDAIITISWPVRVLIVLI